MKKDIFLPADILIPASADMDRWSVIACDQFTSEPEYWARVSDRVGESPSSLHMVVPEAYLESIELDSAAAEKNRAMDQYLAGGIFKEYKNSFIYVEREVTGGVIRRGLVGMVDLDEYDYSADSVSPVRASENTVIARIPPRVAVRKGASLEIPHVMVLMDDPDRRIIEPLTEKKGGLEKIYDFDLMEKGGHITGWRVTGEDAADVSSALRCLGGRAVQMVVGDGNHSLASAKACWDLIKEGLSPAEREGHPAKYALVELNNVYDDGIDFEPIHRVVFGADTAGLRAAIETSLAGKGGRVITWVSGGESWTLETGAETIGALVGGLQGAIEDYISRQGGTVDYIHDAPAAEEMAAEEGNMAFFLPAMDKSDLFNTVISDGVFPKKSFSIGHARDKRYYLECRRITK